ncbi:MAG: protein kinase [Gemmatimonadaceae bacterium]|nr:protein kinase [Gemmatimonadaceae bacterium]
MADSLTALRKALRNRYRIEREIGAGGMATVYLAQDLKHDRAVAVKVLRPELAATLGPDRFPREIRIVAQLSHPHILPLHDSGEANGFLYYVMPFVEGETLRARLHRDGELGVHEAVRLLAQIVDALSYAHKHGVVHRDIKPENVMLTGRHALVADFGISKAVSQSATSDNQLTTVGIALGTPTYMSPEQAMGEPDVDHRADIYAIGAVGYEMLTGRPPFAGPTAQTILAAHVTEQPRPVTERRAAVSALLNQIIMKCLEKNPADRWQTAEELLPLLEQAATPSGGMTPTATRPVKAVAAPRANGMRRVAVGAAALFLLTAAGFGAWKVLGADAKGSGRIERLAVLPIEDISGNDKQFVGSMHDALINALGQHQAITVVSRMAVLKLTQESSRSVRELASELNVDAVIEGTAFRSGNKVRINVQMVDPETSRHLWTQSYERTMSDVLAVQADVVTSIATELEKVLSKTKTAQGGS